MAAAAMITAGMFFTVVMLVMIAPGIGVKIQLTCQERCYRLVRVAGNTAVQSDARLGQRHLRAAANAAADQHIRAQRCQQPRQGTVAAAIGLNDLGSFDLTIFRIVHLELFGVAEMLEDISVCISYRNSHLTSSFKFNRLIDFPN